MAGTSFDAPFIDIDEWRESPRRHRYVHGGFEGTHTLFSFYFPPEEEYSGRFFQYLEGGAGGHESLLAAGGYPGMTLDWVFNLAFDELGGYLVESNQGHYPGEGLGTRRDGTEQAEVNLYGASAETALYGRQLAEEMYGTAPQYGYIWGVSGGGLRTTHCLENRPDVWDGGAPHAGVHNTTQWPTWALAWLVARDKFPQIMDATEPGGGGNPFVGLSHRQREALVELYRRGYPRGAEIQLAPFSPWAFPMYSTMDEDPTYYEDFWNAPGYLGHDDPQALASLLVSERTTVREVVPASKLGSMSAQLQVRFGTAGAASDPSWGVRLKLDLDDPQRLFMSKITILSGKAAGRELLISAIEDDVFSPFSERAPDVFNDVEIGDELEINNRDFLAFCYYHRYAVEGMLPSKDLIAAELKPWTVDGNPIYPQRQTHGRQGESTGKFAGKMIYVQPTLDNMVWNTTISGYERLIHEHHGDRVNEHFRMWWVENAAHGAPQMIGPMQTAEKDPNVWLTRLVSYDGATSQALRDLVAWVEAGIDPPFYTGYRLTNDMALDLPPTAAERGGIQPVVTALANGAIRADIRAGESVTFTGHAEMPPGNGTIVGAEWDFEGRGTWEGQLAEIDGAKSKVDVTTTHTYTEPGTFFACLRVAGHREGAKGRGLPVQNRARTRVVVQP
jgi:Prolyl oligopeptidase family/PKD domain